MMTGTPLAASMAGRLFRNSRPSMTGILMSLRIMSAEPFLNFDESFGTVAGFEDFAEVQAGLAEGSFDDLPHHRRVIYD
jgi:hypothetical protein